MKTESPTREHEKHETMLFKEHESTGVTLQYRVKAFMERFKTYVSEMKYLYFILNYRNVLEMNSSLREICHYSLKRWKLVLQTDCVSFLVVDCLSKQNLCVFPPVLGEMHKVIHHVLSLWLQLSWYRPVVHIQLRNSYLIWQEYVSLKHSVGFFFFFVPASNSEYIFTTPANGHRCLWGLRLFHTHPTQRLPPSPRSLAGRWTWPLNALFMSTVPLLACQN